ncbi:MAG: ABC transporter ATP-binding protein [Anaerolineae bacterium]|nr:ABC transporter ATP-binding protein [Anaerolineae bacterium]
MPQPSEKSTSRNAPARSPQGRGPGQHHGAFLFGKPEKAKNIKGTLLRIWTYLRREKWTLVLIFFLVMVTTGLSLLNPYLFGVAIDTFIAEGDIPGLLRIGLLIIAVALVEGVIGYFQAILMAYISQRTIRNIRKDLFANLQTLSLRYFDQHPHGELMSRLTNDVENISRVLSESATQIISSVLSLVGVAVMMFVINVPLAFVSLLIIPLMVMMTKYISRHTRQGYRDQQTYLGDLNGIIEETISGQRVVQAYVQEQNSIKSFDQTNQKLKKAAIYAQVFSGALGPLNNFVMNTGYTIVAAAGGLLAINNLASIGTIGAFVTYSRRLGMPLNQIASIYNQIQSAIAGAERIFEVMDEESELKDLPEALSLDDVKGRVVFNQVDFGYEENVPVLKKVSLHAEPGQTIALVGPTGAGKTTIINLLSRFYDINDGEIRIDDHEIKQYKKLDIRRQLGVVLQDTFLFADTVMENIRYGRLDATDEEVIEAAKLANAHQFIHRLPDGYQTVLSERGANFSQGQRQLLAIARAVLANPSILILDEATSSVDTRTEVNIQQALLRLMEGRTSFVIAHRLSTIRKADMIMVINHGEIIESGTHDELLKRQGFYYNLYMSQFKGKVEAVIAA